MKLLVPALFIFLLISSCKKEEASGAGFTGTWRLTEIIDHNTATSKFPPASALNNLSVTFRSDGTYSGNTLVNIFWNGTYELKDSNKVSFGMFFSQTYVKEDEFGGGFLTVFMHRMLSSAYPCSPCTYTITGNTLRIQPALRYEIVLKRM